MPAPDNIARELYRSGEYAQALNAYLDLVKQYPHCEDFFICCGNCFDVLGDKKSAVKYYRKAHKHNKKSLPALTNLATALYETGDLQSAEKYCQKALRIDSANVPALINFGNILYRRKEFSQALEYYQKAAVLKPGYFIAELNLANTYFDLKNYRLSFQHADRSAELEPSSVQAWTLLGSSALEQEDYDTALKAFQKALKLDSKDPWLNNYLSQACQKKALWKEAVDHAWQAVEKSGGNDSHHINFGYLLYEAALEKQESLAAPYVEMWLKKYPENPVVLHVANAFKNGRSLEAANPGYVQDIFDVFAPDFEQVLTGLEYRAPNLIAGVLEEIYGTKKNPRLRILDAGCGTGLCGIFLKKYARWRGLDGVDLSAGMLKEASAKKLYSRLIRRELVEFLQSRKSAYDLIVSADVFTYIGDLEKLFFAAAESLTKKGRIIFTVSENSINGEEWFLHVSGRYLHKKEYVEKILAKAGFQIEKINREKLRNEGDSPVMGYVFSAKVIK